MKKIMLSVIILIAILITMGSCTKDNDNTKRYSEIPNRFLSIELKIIE